MKLKKAFSHLDARGNARMVNVGGKPVQRRRAVAAALATLTGEKAPSFRRGLLADPLDEAACPRETLWPARLDWAGLHPLPWASSGDVTCLAEANALVRVPPDCQSLAAGAAVDFLAPNL